MAKLNSTHKKFILNKLATFKQPSEVIALVKDQFGLEVSRQQVAYYNPDTNQSNRELASKWKYLFEETRKEYLEEVKKIPLAHQGFRLRILQKALNIAVEDEDADEVRKIAETAAKEVGGKFTNEELKSKDENKPQKTINIIKQLNQKAKIINKKQAAADPDHPLNKIEKKQ